ncbi:hypothetical protein GCM10010254_10280 [Streptomyces chromofuscus]|nr:hypothetical protein GCM10010254_10280 [Streptomyces chromofuscus]
MERVGQPLSVTADNSSLTSGSEPEAVLLVVSELFANAVWHAGGVTGFRLEAKPGAKTLAVAVAVDYASTLPPRPRPLDPGRRAGSAGIRCRRPRPMCR